MKRLLFLLLHILIVNISWAQYASTDLSYTCQGAGKYQIKLEVYTECGTDGGLVSENRFPLYLKSEKLKIELEDVYFDRASIKNEPVRLYCSQVGDNCGSITSPNRGLRKSVFYKIIDLSAYTATDDWEVSFLFDFKDKVFTNMVLPEKYPHISYTYINTTNALCNNSPNFSENPILKTCLNKTDTINLGIIDPDGDQLVYSLATPITKFNGQIVDMTYKGGFSQLRPLSLTSDLKITADGRLIMSGTRGNDVGSVDVIIDEFRGGIKIGSTRRNLQINTLNCNNQAPSISDFVNPTDPQKRDQIVICSGGTLTKNRSLITINDADVTNSIKDIQILPRDSRLNGVFTYSLLNANNAEIFSNNAVIFTTDKDETILVDIRVTDNGCPSELTTLKTFTVLVKAKPVFDFGYETAFLRCNPATVLKPLDFEDPDLTDAITPRNLTGTAPFTYKWKTWHMVDGEYVVINPNISTSESLTVNTESGVTVTITDQNGCSSTDSIFLFNGFFFGLDIRERCLGNDSTVFKDLSYSSDPQATITKRVWTFGDNTSLQTTDTEFKKKYCAAGLFPITLEVENSKGCKEKYEDSLRIHRAPEADFIVTTNCVNRLFIKDNSNYFPARGGVSDFKSYGYAGANYYVTKVHSGLDTTVKIRVKTYADIKVICDSIYLRLKTDSAALTCTKHNITPPYTFKFSALNVPNRDLNQIINISETPTDLIFNFKEFEFGDNYSDTILKGTTIQINISKANIQNRAFVDRDSILIQDKETSKSRICKAFVREDMLNMDIPIGNHPSEEADDYIFPHLTFTWEKQNNRIQIDSGIYLIKQIVNSQAQCSAETIKEVRIYGEPKIALADVTRNIILPDTLTENCLSNDTTLYAKIIDNPNGGLQYSWKFNPSEVNIDNPSFSTSDMYSASELGTYYLYVQDSRQCDDTVAVTLVSYLKPNFEVSPSCETDTVTFSNKSLFTKGPKIIENKWILTDFDADTLISEFTNDDSTFIKVIEASSDVKVRLIVKDSLNCEREVEKNIFKSKFEDIFEFPDSRTASVCVSDKIFPKSILLLNKTNHIDSIVWNLGNGQKAIQRGNTNAELDNFFFTYTDDQVYTVSFTVYYNGKVEKIYAEDGTFLRDSIIQPTCIYQSGEKEIGIKPEFKGKLFSFRNCTSDTSEFIFEKDPTIGDNTIKVQQVDWRVEARSNEVEPDLTFPIYQQDAYSFKKLFKKARELRIYFTAKDDNGCVFEDSTDAKIDELGRPIIVGLDSACFGSESTIRLRSDNLTIDGNIRPANKYGIDYLGNQIVLDRYETSTGTENVKYRFPDSGNLPIKAYMIQYFSDVKSITTDKVQECRGVIDTSIYVKPYPDVNFRAPEVCAKNDTTKFLNLTKFRQFTTDPKDSLIVGYIWDFGDGTPKSNLKNPNHVYALGGEKQVTLTAIAANGCSTSKTLPVSVKNSPIAFFSTSKDSSLLDFNEPIEFINKTQGEDVNAFLWQLGDGEISNDFEPIHIYKNIDRFQVTLTATNELGCSDTYTKVAELKPILLLPNVFSPNNDGENDNLFLIYRLIEQLEEFKIYNRWGELVFDSNGNLNARWDGKHKGVDQELGVYVAYVKARGKHGYNYNFKQNITLLR